MSIIRAEREVQHAVVEQQIAEQQQIAREHEAHVASDERNHGLPLAPGPRAAHDAMMTGDIGAFIDGLAR